MKKSKPASHTWQVLRKRGDPTWYTHYLRSHHWRRLRKTVLSERNFACQECAYTDPNQDRKRGTRLDIHHKSYQRIGHERRSDLEVLCHRCHKKRHRSPLGRLATFMLGR